MDAGRFRAQKYKYTTPFLAPPSGYGGDGRASKNDFLTPIQDYVGLQNIQKTVRYTALNPERYKDHPLEVLT
jgi:hypothetical protein